MNKGQQKMKQSTIERIIVNHDHNKLTYIGAYAYKINGNYIIRCNRADLGRHWIDSNGNMFDGWKKVEKI